MTTEADIPDELEQLPNEVAQDHLKAIVYHIDQGMLSRRDIEFLKTKSVAHLNKLNRSEDKEYLNLGQGMTAYSKILDTGITAQEALEYVAECYGKDSAWVDEVKNNNYLHAKEVVKGHTEHPIQQAMKKDGTLRVKALAKVKTPNQQLRELHSQRKLHATLNALKEDNLKLDNKVGDLEATAVITESNVDLVMFTLDLEQLSTKDKASKLKARGLTQKKIAEYLGVTTRTLRRWWDEL